MFINSIDAGTYNIIFVMSQGAQLFSVQSGKMLVVYGNTFILEIMYIHHPSATTTQTQFLFLRTNEIATDYIG